MSDTERTAGIEAENHKLRATVAAQAETIEKLIVAGGWSVSDWKPTPWNVDAVLSPRDRAEFLRLAGVEEGGTDGK